MTYAAFLVPIEADPEPDHRLTFAIDLANQFDARLIGVGAEIWRTPIGGYANGGHAMGALVEMEIAEVDADLERAEVKFRSAAAAVRRGGEWRSAVQFPSVGIAAEARAADLVVTSRSVRQDASAYNVAAPGALVLQAGRPVIIAPAEPSALVLRSVVVAWKDTRESRRAVADALPFLKLAGTVVVAEVCDHSDAAESKARLDDVADSLLRHGVSATTAVWVEEKDVHAPQQFLEVAAEHKADLIVAGGYGRSRFQEWIFGGFTRALLAQTSRAVLLSH